MMALLILAIAACATTGNRGGDDGIIFGMGTDVIRDPVPYVQDLGKHVFRPGEKIAVMVVVKGYIGEKIRLDFIKIDDQFTRTVISETVPASSGGVMLWWHRETIWNVKDQHPEPWVAQLHVGPIVKRHEFVVSP